MSSKYIFLHASCRLPACFCDLGNDLDAWPRKGHDCAVTRWRGVRSACPRLPDWDILGYLIDQGVQLHGFTLLCKSFVLIDISIFFSNGKKLCQIFSWWDDLRIVHFRRVCKGRALFSRSTFELTRLLFNFLILLYQQGHKWLIKREFSWKYNVLKTP